MTYPDTPSTQADRDRVVAAAQFRMELLRVYAEDLDRMGRTIFCGSYFGRECSLCFAIAAELRQLAGEEPDDDEARR